MSSITTAVPAPVPAPPPFSRRAWEQAVFHHPLHPGTKVVALALVHMAGGAGRLPAGGPQTLGRLAAWAGLAQDNVRKSLVALEERGFITRPDIHTWKSRMVWPITLTMPPAPEPAETAQHGEAGAVRTEPGHPGPAAS